MKEQSSDLEQLLTAYISTLNPLRRFPNEILAQIFKLCVDEDVNIARRMRNTGRGENCPSTLDTRKCPWVLGQVCRRWRNLAVSLSDLWTSVDINWKEGLSGEVMDSCVERRLSLTLQRSRDRPLYVSWSQSSCQEKVFSVMLSRSYQWKHATLRGGIRGYKLLAPHCGLFPSLSTLHLHFDEDDWGELPQEIKDVIFSVFRNAPALNDLTFSGHLGPVAPHLFVQIPWKQITHFAVEKTEGLTTDIRPIVPLLTSVSDCYIGAFKLSGGLLRPPSTLRHLRQLILGPSSSAETLFDSLTLPALQMLAFIRCFPSALAFARFLHRSSCQLTELGLIDVQQRDLMEALQDPAVQGVKNLTISGPLLHGTRTSGSGDSVLHALRLRPAANGPGSENILLKLTQLALWGTKQWSDTCLVDLLASRVNLHPTLLSSASRLQTVRFDGFSSTASENGAVVSEEAASARMKGLVEGGLVVLVNDKPVVF
ncbi:hypothetical protein V5O48_010971 [Marasmius crinis-equi]|uniref:F-box domain-containing protein n=1 Tax=Marasmius crinis-equi TaxID=585013 RepID=A0ABR3F6X7_9AGAR